MQVPLRKGQSDTTLCQSDQATSKESGTLGKIASASIVISPWGACGRTPNEVSAWAPPSFSNPFRNRI